MSEAKPSLLTVYYDGACPICSREIATYQKQPGAENCAWVDASQAEPERLGPGLNSEQALARMHVRQADGTLVHGAAAFALMWQAFPATRWLGRFAALAPVNWILEGAYRVFLRVRPLWRPSAQAPTGSPGGLAITPELGAELRSDHAGETGAVAIYRGILAITRNPELRSFAEHHLATEQDHLVRIEPWLPAAQRSRLLPLWKVAGWVTGALPAAFGPKAVYRTIEAVETFVDRHYAAQIEMIDRLPPDPTRLTLRALLVHCQADEVAHREDAAERVRSDGKPGLAARGWAWLVGFGSEAAVSLARRI